MRHALIVAAMGLCLVAPARADEELARRFGPPPRNFNPVEEALRAEGRADAKRAARQIATGGGWGKGQLFDPPGMAAVAGQGAQQALPRSAAKAATEAAIARRSVEARQRSLARSRARALQQSAAIQAQWQAALRRSGL